jgi:hypothetical protein
VELYAPQCPRGFPPASGWQTTFPSISHVRCRYKCG